MENGRCIYCKKNNWRICVGCEQNLTTANYRRGQPLCLDCEAGGTVYDKVCKLCGKSRPSDTFRPNSKECMDCVRASGRDYRRTTTKAKDWANNNRERMAELQKNHYENNKKEIRVKEQTRKAVDPVFKSIKDYRSEICHLVKGKLRNSKSLITNQDDYVYWLQSLFYNDEMTIENYGVLWNVDHILPLDLLFKKPVNKWCWSLLESYDLKTILYSWYNTQPLLKKDNRLKGSEINPKSLEKHLKILDKYMTDYAVEKDDTYKTYRKIMRLVINTFY
jgi:hypothetical protein